MLPSVFAIDAPGNGVRVQAWRQAEALARAGHEVVRLNPWEYNDLNAFDVVQFYMGGFAMHMIESFCGARRAVLAFAPIIDSNQSFIAYRLAAAAGVALPRLSTVPGEFRRQARASDLVIARSTHERQRIVRGLGIDDAKVEIVLNGVDPVADADPDHARRELGITGEFILHVSGYTQQRKNPVRMVQAIGPTGYPLVLAGTAAQGPTLDRLRELVKTYPSVRLLPFVDRRTLQGLYAACRVFCLPSVHEGTGLAALEAAALGARIVITRNGGPPDYFGEHAQYVDPFSIEDIRAAVQRAWQAPLSDALRQHVLTNLTWDNSARALVEAYQRHQRGRAD